MARFRPLRWLAGLLFNHWGTKMTALVLAAVFFIGTREDVTVQLSVPLHLIEDPERVLRTKLPEKITVEVHGSWSRIKRLTTSDLGTLELDLKSVKEGKLNIDESTLVMPSGVILRSLLYDGVDVRFDKIIERDFPVKSVINVNAHEDYEFVDTVTNPSRITLRGPKTVIQEISTLTTEPEELQNVTRTQEIVKSVLRPREGVEFAHMAKGERPEVTIKVTIRPKPGERKFTVPIGPVPEEVPSTVVIPKTLKVTVRGPRPDLRKLDGITDPIESSCQIEPPADASENSPSTLVVDFRLGAVIPEELAASLSLVPSRMRYAIVSAGADEGGANAGARGGGRGKGGGGGRVDEGKRKLKIRAP
jgi:YbbR domain-containing protein